MYGEDDEADFPLLNRLGKWIMYNNLAQLALHLGFTMAEISRIIIPSRRPEEQIFEVSSKYNDPFKVTTVAFWVNKPL